MQVVILVGTILSDERCAHPIARSGIVQVMNELGERCMCVMVVVGLDCISGLCDYSVAVCGEGEGCVAFVTFILQCAYACICVMTLPCMNAVLQSMVDLLKAKQEDDEIVLQIVYVWNKLLFHEATRELVLAQSTAVLYLLDLMHDKVSGIMRPYFAETAL